MLNAYMGYSLIRSELTKAIDYSNIMESAHSILRVADSDLKTFETRFDSMAVMSVKSASTRNTQPWRLPVPSNTCRWRA